MILLLPGVVFATIGVGVGSGKITVDEKLKAGSIYELPSVPVLNTGDEPAEYGMSVEYHQDQPQLKPLPEWFNFVPSSFRLEPKKSQLVKITLNLPLKATPGDYFAYLKAHPVQKDVPGQASIGIAAATKLYFVVAPSNIFQGLYYRIISVLRRYSPWTYVVLTIAAVGILLSLIQRRFSFSVGIKRK